MIGNILSILGSVFIAWFPTMIVMIIYEEMEKGKVEDIGKKLLIILMVIFSIMIIIHFHSLKVKDNEYIELVRTINNAEDIEEVKDYLDTQDKKDEALEEMHRND